MGLTKQYLRYVPDGNLNFVASQKSNILVIEGQTETKGTTRVNYVCFACCENLYVWDPRKNLEVMRFVAVKEEITCIASAGKKQLLAAGYSDGSMALFSLLSEELLFSQKTHKSSISNVNFNASGAILATGSNDTEVMLWDTVGNAAICRLKGHKSPITDIRFMDHHPYLLTSAKDSLIKIWDLHNFRCCSTLVGHKAEVCKFVIVNEDNRLITGSVDSEIRIFDLTFSDSENMNFRGPVQWKYFGSLIRTGKERISGMTLDSQKEFLAFQGNDSILEVLQLHTDERIRELVERRIKKERKKRKTADIPADQIISHTGTSLLDDVASTADMLEFSFKRFPVAKVAGKISSSAFLTKPVVGKKLLISTGNSLLNFDVDTTNSVLTETARLALPGHKTDMRTVAISSDGSIIISSCSEQIRIWNREASQCIHTIPCEYAVSSVLFEDDRYLILGTKGGKLELLDVVEGIIRDSIHAHEGPVWGICHFQSNKNLISGSEDKEVKLWDLEFGQSEGSRRTMTLCCRKALKMEEGITAVKLSPDERLLAIAMLDNTVKVLFADTFKFFLSLYGHSLPVTCIDISSDSMLITTGSADRNIKIWGLDFGDCHKSIYAHDDSVTCVKFVPRSHLLFSAGRDGKIKQWDADVFERITTLDGHHGEIWAMAISSNGRTLVSTSRDKNIRIWQKTDEILVLEEERENEREAEAEKDMVNSEETVIAGETNIEIGIAGRRTLAAIQAAEKLVEAMNLVKEEDERMRSSRTDSSNPILVAFGNISAPYYLLEVLKRVKPSELQGTLLALSLNEAVELVRILTKLLFENPHTELILKCLTYLLRINALQVESNQLLLSELDHLRCHGTEKIDLMRDVIGFNRAALESLQRQIEEREEVRLFADATKQFAEKKKKYKSRIVKNMA